MRVMRPVIRISFHLIHLYRRIRWGEARPSNLPEVDGLIPEADALVSAPVSYTHKPDYDWVRRSLRDLQTMEIRVWRSVNAAFLKAFVHRKLFGMFWLRVLFWCEDQAPHFFGRFGQHPMIIFSKPAGDPSQVERRER